MPEDLYKIFHNEDADWDPEIELIREIRLEDWRKCTPYAKRIRALQLGKSFGVTEDALLALCLFRRAECLLPRLKSFTLTCSSTAPKNMDEWLPRMLPPGLSRFSIYPERTPHICVPLAASQLTSLCPLLKELVFNCYIVKDGSFPPIHQPIELLPAYRRCLDVTNDLAQHGWEHIEKLNLGKLSVGPEVLCHLSAFQSLRALVLSFNDSRQYLQNNDHCEFLHLAKLELDGISWSTASSCLDMLVKSPLKWLVLSVSGVIPGPQCTFIERFLSKLAHLPNLAHIYISQDDEEMPIPLEGAAGTMGLELAQLKNVDGFAFLGSPAALLGDAWYAAISPSWTLLTEFSLYPVDQRPTATLEGLLPLIRNCPALTRLEASVICFPFQISPATKNEFQHSKIDYVDFIYSPFGAGMTTAILVELLLYMFPAVDIIRGESSPSPQPVDPWTEVNKELELVIVARDVQELPAKSEVDVVYVRTKLPI